MYRAGKVEGQVRFRAFEVGEQPGAVRLLFTHREHALELVHLVTNSLKETNGELVEVFVPGVFVADDFDQTVLSASAAKLERMIERTETATRSLTSLVERLEAAQNGDEDEGRVVSLEDERAFMEVHGGSLSQERKP